jgi:group I intron endonuclease
MLFAYYGVIYLITNLVNGKQYVGQTLLKPPMKRWERGHIIKAGAGTKGPLYSAIRKYGKKSFSFEVIWYVDCQISLDLSERLFVNLFKTRYPFGYNLREGGRGGGHSEITKQRLREAMTPEAIVKFIERMNSPKVRDKQRNTLAQTLADPELSKTWRESMQTPEYREKMRLIGIDVMSRPEVIDRVSKGVRQALLDQDYRDRKSLGIRLALAKPEEKERRSRKSSEVNARPERLEQIRLLFLGTIWINNGVKNSHIKRGELLPDGWEEGVIQNPTEGARSRATKGRYWITDGIKQQRRIKPEDIIPNGWYRGQLPFSWITDGVGNRHIDKNGQVPDDWILGYTRKSKK